MILFKISVKFDKNMILFLFKNFCDSHTRTHTHTYTQKSQLKTYLRLANGKIFDKIEEQTIFVFYKSFLTRNFCLGTVIDFILPLPNNTTLV